MNAQRGLRTCNDANSHWLPLQSGPAARKTNHQALKASIGVEKGILPNLVPSQKLPGQLSELYLTVRSP